MCIREVVYVCVCHVSMRAWVVTDDKGSERVVYVCVCQVSMRVWVVTDDKGERERERNRDITF